MARLSKCYIGYDGDLLSYKFVSFQVFGFLVSSFLASFISLATFSIFSQYCKYRPIPSLITIPSLCVLLFSWSFILPSLNIIRQGFVTGLFLFSACRFPPSKSYINTLLFYSLLILLIPFHKLSIAFIGISILSQLISYLRLNIFHSLLLLTFLALLSLFIIPTPTLMASRTIGLNLTPFIFLIISVFFAFSLKLSRSFFNSFLDYILVAGLFVTLTLGISNYNWACERVFMVFFPLIYFKFISFFDSSSRALLFPSTSISLFILTFLAGIYAMFI